MSNAALATAYVQIMPSFDGMRGAIERELGGSIGTTGEKAGEEFGRQFSEKAKTALAAAGAALAAGTALFLKGSVDAASDLNETLSKTSVVLGDAASKVQAFADNAAGTLGMSKQAALDAASSFAVFGKSAGLAGDDLAGFSTNLTGLAADMASFSNTTPQQAIDALGAALRGESEPIRAYGVLLDDASLRQEALRQGLIQTTTQALTPQQRVLAAYQLILQQTADAQGDFARTSDGLANQQRILAAQFDNIKASVGTALLPALVAAAGALTPILDAFASLPGPVQTAIVLIGGFGTALVLVLPKLLAFKAELAALSPTAATAAGAIGKATAALAVVGTVVAVAVPYLEQAKSALDEWSKSVLGIPKPVGIEQATVAMRDFVKASTDAQIAEALRGIGTALAELATDSAADYLRDLQYGLQGITSPTEAAVAQLDQLDAILASLYSSGNVAEAERLWNQLVEQAAAAGMSVDDLKSRFNDYTAAVASANLATGDIVPPTEEATGSFSFFENALAGVTAVFDLARESGEKYRAAVESVQRIHADMDDMRFEATLSGLDSVTAATRRLAYEQQQLNELRAQGAGLVDVAEQEREVLRAQLALTEAQRVAAEQAAAAAEQAREELRRARQAVADAIGGPFVADLLKGSAESITSTLRDLTTKIRDAVGGAVASGLADMIEQGNNRLVSAAKRRDRIVSRLEDAKAKLEALEQSRTSLEDQVRSQAYGGLVQFGNQALQPDAEGVAPSASQAAQGIVARLQQRLREIRDFSSNLKKLAGRGLPQQFINELIQAGPIDGGPTARLLANASETDFQSIKSSASTLYTESSNLAKQAGSTMYSTGIQAAQGLVDGLKAKEQAIAAQMTRIAKIMVATIRQALGIRSPSRAFAGVGASIGDGLVVGIADRQGAVRAAVSGLVAVPSAQIAATVGARGAAAAGGVATGGFTVHQLTVNNPAPEPASTSTAAGLRRTAFLLGASA